MLSEVTVAAAGWLSFRNKSEKWRESGTRLPPLLDVCLKAITAMTNRSVKRQPQQVVYDRGYITKQNVTGNHSKARMNRFIYGRRRSDTSYAVET